MPPRGTSPLPPKKTKNRTPPPSPQKTSAPRPPAVPRPPRASPDPHEAGALRAFAKLESSAGPAARKLAERASERTLESFVRKMGHHFVKPIEALYSAHRDVTQLLGRPELDHAALVANAGALLQATRRAHRLLERTRAAVLLEPAHMCEEPVAPLVEEVRAAVVSELGDRAARFDFTADIEEGLAVHADHPYLSRALVDLVKNGAEAYPAANPRYPVRLTARGRGRTVEILIADEGFGWDAETVPYAFVPFSSGKPTGTGLGLFLARRTVEDIHGGRLTLESDGYGHGTRLRLVLPRRQRGVKPRRRLTMDELRREVARRERERASRAAARASARANRA